MSKFCIYLSVKDCSTNGLTLVEVMVGMLISALFLSTALQAYVSAISIKAKAQQGNVIISTIHSDLETIRQIAQEIPSDAENCKGNLLEKTLENVRNADSDKHNAHIEQIQKDGVIKQSMTWPLIANSDNYQIHRILSTDNQRVVNPSNLLHIFYEVTYGSDAQIGGDGDAAVIATKTVAKLRTSVMPNAVLVCP